MRTIIIDNNDSFTYNLAHYVTSLNFNVDVFRASDIMLDCLEEYDKIIFSPGPGLPNEHPLLEKIIDIFYRKKSILGVCLGHQAIATYFNADIYNLSNVKHGIASTVYHKSNCSLFNNIPKSFLAGHYHSWAISPNNFPDCLEITSTNTEGIIMSIKHKEFDIKGVQFHPESVLTKYGLSLIRNWLIS